MKQIFTLKIMKKIFVLSFLAGGLLFVTLDNQFTRSSCASTRGICDFLGQLQLFDQCGNSLNNTVQGFNNRNTFCAQPASVRCNPADPGYSYCLQETPVACIARNETAYDNRYPTYGNCVTGMDSVMYNPTECTASFDPCPDIVYAVDQCRIQFPATGPNNWEEFAAQTACIESLPHVVPSKGGYTCPGTNYIPQ